MARSYGSDASPCPFSIRVPSTQVADIMRVSSEVSGGVAFRIDPTGLMSEVYAGNPGDGKLSIQIAASGNSGAFTGLGFIVDPVDGSGFLYEFQGPTSGLAASVVITLPSASGTLITAGATTNLTLGSSTSINTSSIGAGFNFRDGVSNTKKLYLQLSGAVGNNGIKVETTAARTYTLTDQPGYIATDGNIVTMDGDVLTMDDDVVILP